MYESGLKTERSRNGSGYQETYEEFFQQIASNCDRKCPTAGPIKVKKEFPFVDQIWETSIQVVY